MKRTTTEMKTGEATSMKQEKMNQYTETRTSDLLLDTREKETNDSSLKWITDPAEFKKPEARPTQ